MTAREWQPGDVALSPGASYRVFRTENGWVFDDGSGTTRVGEDVAGFRPLVVIDPEDRAQVERLAGMYIKQWLRNEKPAGRTLDVTVSQMRDALRELANPTPPKPVVTAEMVAAMRQQVEWDRERSSYWQERERDHRGLSAVEAWLDSLADHLGDGR